MLRIRAVKIEINTAAGLSSTVFRFSGGLNIIRGNNTSGKSTLVQSILYCLGMEELLGGKNEKTMQSVLKDEIEFDSKKYKVLESTIYLELSNIETITIKRSVKNENKDSRLVQVFEGALLTSEISTTDSKFMYVHDRGAATDGYFGFHSYLETFLGIKLPEVEYFQGENRKMYLQTIFPAFIIEQKTGWGGFLKTIPQYGMRNASSRAIEFLLGLDVLENDKKRQEIAQRKTALTARWENTIEDISRLAKYVPGKAQGIEKKPIAINEDTKIYITTKFEEADISLTEYISILQGALQEAELKKVGTVADNANENEEELSKLSEQLERAIFTTEMLQKETSIESNKLSSLRLQLQETESDLRKNRGAQKVKLLGAEINTQIAIEHCPTCQQSVKDFLLPQDLHQHPMGIEENIKYLEEQKRMIGLYLKGQEATLEDKKYQFNYFQKRILELRKRIREIRRELVTDDRVPSETEIEKKIDLRKTIESLFLTQSQLEELKKKLLNLSSDWVKILADQSELPKEVFSPSDKEKLRSLEEKFKSLLIKFGYTSKDEEYVNISYDSYLPTVDGLNAKLNTVSYDIKYDSSASDFIRSIWSFTCALYLISSQNSGYHPGFMIFDEPAQHSMSNDSLRRLLMELSTYNDAQSIVAASFNNSENDFLETTKGISFSLIETGAKLINPGF